MIKIEIPKRKGNVIYKSDDGKRYYLAICIDHVKEERQKMEWGQKTPAYMFDGNFFTLSQSTPVIFRLFEHIKHNCAFTIGGGGRPLSKHRGMGKDISLANLLYSFYSDICIEQTIGVNVRCVNNNVVILSNITDREEDEFLKDHYVYNFTRGNLVSDVGGAVIHSNGHIFVNYPAMGVKCDGRNFYTSYDQGLCNLLASVPNWNIDNGALRANLGKGKSGSNIYIPFSSIVVAYHRGLVPNGTNNIREKLKAVNKEIIGKQLLADHLTERKGNNYPFLLALTNSEVNDATRNFRTRIEKPFFFYSAVDHARNRCLVWLGIEDTGWEKYIVFGDLSDEKEYKLYLHCFNKFKRIVQAAGCFLKKPGDDSLLYYWAAPERMNDRRNPLIQILSKPMDIFTVYHDGIFVGIPKSITPWV